MKVTALFLAALIALFPWTCGCGGTKPSSDSGNGRSRFYPFQVGTYGLRIRYLPDIMPKFDDSDPTEAHGEIRVLASGEITGEVLVDGVTRVPVAGRVYEGPLLSLDMIVEEKGYFLASRTEQFSLAVQPGSLYDTVYFVGVGNGLKGGPSGTQYLFVFRPLDIVPPPGS